MTTDLELNPGETRRLVLGAVFRQPQDGWTVQRLATTLGLPSSAVLRAIGDLTQVGLVARIDDEFVSGITLA